MEGINHERIIHGFINLGLRQSEAEVYVHLAKHGPQGVRSISKALKIQAQYVHRILGYLRDREIVNASPKHPAEFIAIPFEKAMELLIKSHLRESQNIEEEKDEILKQWHSMLTKQS